MELAYDIITIVAITTLIQSIFGVGILLFGTPLMLGLGYNFINVIIILLPISLLISTIQALRHYKLIDLKFCKYILLYSVPVISIVLFFVVHIKIDINIVVGSFLVFVAAKEYFSVINKMVMVATKNTRIYIVLMGVIHGMTNLGGSLLTAIIHAQKYNKNTTRATIAASYGIFAFFQIITLAIADTDYIVDRLSIIIYTLISLAVFIVAEKYVYLNINDISYAKYFSIFLLLSGVFICIKSI